MIEYEVHQGVGLDIREAITRENVIKFLDQYPTNEERKQNLLPKFQVLIDFWQQYPQRSIPDMFRPEDDHTLVITM